MASNKTKGTYFNKTEAKQAKIEPIKFSKIKFKFLVPIIPNVFKKYANKIRKTPIKPNQSVKFIQKSI